MNRAMIRRPAFIVLEGMDGSGKTTHQALLAEWLCQKGLTVTTCREPGNTELGNQLRTLLLRTELPLQPITEALLFMAARAELVSQVIRPALHRGEWVVCDRFLLSTIVYQGHAGGVDLDLLWSLGQTVVAGLTADLTFVLDVPVDIAVSRSHRHVTDRFESRGVEYQQRIRQGFLDEASRHPDRVRVVDATGTIDEVQQRIRLEVGRVVETHTGS